MNIKTYFQIIIISIYDGTNSNNLYNRHVCCGGRCGKETV